MDPNLAAALIAGLTAVLGWIVGRQQLRHSDHQIRLGAAAFAADWFRDFRSWASEAIDVLSDATYCCIAVTDGVPPDPVAVTRCRSRLSSLIDQGRFFLPNLPHESYGANKPSAYRGYRQPALDYLIEAEQLLGGHKRAEYAAFGNNSREVLVSFRREFVSAVHDILDPRTRNAELREVLAATAASADRKRILPAPQ